MQMVRDIRLIAFDTEATSIHDERGTYAVLYSWQGLELTGKPDDVYPETIDACTHRYEGRDCESLYEWLDSLLLSGELVKIAVHNLSYDYMYLRKWLLKVSEVIEVSLVCKSSTRILSVVIGKRKSPLMIIFDTLSIFGYSLRQLGENLGYPKGDIDYHLEISPNTKLGDDHIYYNNRDTEILMVGICRSLLTRDGITLETLGDTILTKTSIVRLQDRQSKRIGGVHVTKRRTIYDEDRQTVKSHVIRDLETYLRWSSYSSTIRTPIHGCYAGGVNISNANMLGTVIHDVHSIDLKSAYPAIMVSYMIPTNPVKIENLEAYSYLLRRCAPNPMDVIIGKAPFWLGTVEFEGLRIDDKWRDMVGDVSVTESMILQHMQENVNPRYTDGYFQGGEKIALTLSSSIFFELCLQYDFECARFIELELYMGHERPTRYSLLRVLHHFREKSWAKHPSPETADEAYRNGYISFDEHETIKRGDYTEAWMRDFTLRHKGNLNSLYGIMVTDQVRNSWYLGDHAFPASTSKDLPENQSRDSWMWREAGVLIAVYNRYKLLYCVRKLIDNGRQVVYCDTDSIKFTGDPDIKPLLSSLDSAIEMRNMQVMGSLIDGLNAKAGENVYEPFPTDIDDFRDLGKFDYEGTYQDFFTTGHKKYAHGDGSRWRIRASGYRIDVLESFASWLCSEGLYNVCPNIVLGYDVVYDESCDIASAQIGIDDEWTEVDFLALADTGKDDMRRYQGETCPGNAIVSIPKVMNDSKASKLNAQRAIRCVRNYPDNKTYFDTTVSRHDGKWEMR